MIKRLDASRLARPRLCVQSLEPAFGENYKPGFIGFTHTGSSQQSVGITLLTRWSRLSDIHVSHVLVVTGDNEGVEIAAGKAVTKTSLDRYFQDPATQLFFRKPRKCTPALGQRIAETALSQVGTKFDALLTAAQMLEGSFLRRWMLSHFQGCPDHFATRLRNREPRWLAAELAAYCLDCQGEYADRGLLAQARMPIDPQSLFEDGEIFASWQSEPAEGPKAGIPREA